MKASRFEFGEELIRLAAEHRDFLVCNPDTQSCGLENFDKIYPGRAYNFGIAEQNLLGAAAGMASCGNKVFVPTFAVFLTMRACEQIRHFICYPKLDVVLLGTHTGLQVGKDGGTHIACEDVGILRTMANMTIVQPADGIAARAMANFALEFQGPLYIRLHREAVPTVNKENYQFRFNRAEILCDYGGDIALVASGVTVCRALEAAERLRAQGIGAKVLDIQTIKPIDRNTLTQVAAQTKAMVTIEDHNIYGGLGSAVAEVLAETKPVKIKMLGIQDAYGESAGPEDLYRHHGLTVEQITSTCLELMGSR